MSRKLKPDFFKSVAVVVDLSKNQLKKNNKIEQDPKVLDKVNETSPQKYVLGGGDNQKYISKESSAMSANSLTPLDVPKYTKKDSKPNHWRFYDRFSCCKTRLAIVLYSLCPFICALIAAITLIVLYSTYSSRNFALLNESCLTKQCDPSKFLKCVNGTCQCYDFYNQIFNQDIKGCETKSLSERLHGEYCQIGTTNCLNTSLCIDSICQCNSTTHYWNGTHCSLKKTYNSICTNRNTTNNYPYYLTENCVDNKECIECSNVESLLTCINNACTCSNSSFYFDTTLSKCIQLKNYYSSCSTSLECDSTLGLYCTTNTLSSYGHCPTLSISNRCDCLTGYYYDFTLGSCNKVKSYYRPCTTDCECDSTKGLQCFNDYCTCPAYSWFNLVTLSCSSPNVYNTLCSKHYECRSDLGLSCINSTCDCASPGVRTYWSTTASRCVEWYS
jgi:hypothetical protein